MRLSFHATRTTGFVVLLAAAALAACDPAPTTPAGDAGPGTDAFRPSDGGSAGSIVDIAVGNPNFSILVAAATRAGLVDTLAAGTFTVFAPTDAAFAASGITRAMVDTMPVPQLTGILTYHAVAGEVRSTALRAGPVASVAMLSLIVGTTGGVTINGGNAVTGGANVVTADIIADNGVIHIIDRVLLPPTVADLTRYAGLTTLAGAVGTAGLADDLAATGPFTVFAPTNAAFAALPAVPTGAALTSVLLYHVVGGVAVPSTGVPAMASSLSVNAYGDPLTLLFSTTSGVVINGGPTVVIADVRGTNGIVHVIDEVILPMNVVGAATAAGLTGLLGAVGAAADLPGGPSVAAALAAEAPYTVFAPTNAAFTAIASTLATLTPAQVRDVLHFHVLDTTTFAAPVLAADLPSGTTELDTLAAGTVTLDTSATPPTVEGQDIVITDIVVTNGVVHVIDGVMIPPG